MDDLDINDHVEPSVFGEEDDDPFAVPPPLASLPPPTEDTGDIRAENGVLNIDGENEGQDKQSKTKKRSPRPRVNLNEARLCSPKGVEALKNICADIKLKGKGHEESDLNKLLQQFEHWAQCLMPMWPFENVVTRCEKLGVKRSVQNELKRLRRDEDDILRGESEDEQEEGGTATTEEHPEQQLEVHPGQESEVAPSQDPPVQLTEEQLERIRKNRELAFARREALKKRKLLAEQSQQEDTNEQSETDQNPLEEHNNLNDGDGDSREMPTSEQNDVDSARLNTTEIQRMDQSLEESMANEHNNFNNEHNTAGTVTSHTDNDNIHEASAEEQEHNGQNDNLAMHSEENNISHTVDLLTNMDEINEDNSPENCSEIPSENGILSGKPCVMNGEINDVPDEFGETTDTINTNKGEATEESTHSPSHKESPIDNSEGNNIDHNKTDQISAISKNTGMTTENSDLKNDEDDPEHMVIDGTGENNADITNDDATVHLSEKEKMPTQDRVNEIAASGTSNDDEMDTEIAPET